MAAGRGVVGVPQREARNKLDALTILCVLPRAEAELSRGGDCCEWGSRCEGVKEVRVPEAKCEGLSSTKLPMHTLLMPMPMPMPMHTLLMLPAVQLPAVQLPAARCEIMAR